MKKNTLTERKATVNVLYRTTCDTILDQLGFIPGEKIATLVPVVKLFDTAARELSKVECGTPALNIAGVNYQLGVLIAYLENVIAISPEFKNYQLEDGYAQSNQDRYLSFVPRVQAIKTLCELTQKDWSND